MRNALKDLNGQKSLFIGTFKFIRSRNSHHKVMLLLNITNEEGTLLTDHAWVTYNKKFKELDLNCGDTIKFYGTVKPYITQRKGIEEVDLGITYTTKVVKI